MAKGGAEGDYLADLPGRYQLSGLLVGLGQPLVLADKQPLARFFRLGQHALALLQGDGHGLLAQHMLARLQGLDGQIGVGEVGHADGNRINGRVVQQLLGGGIGLNAILGGDLLTPLGIQVEKADQIGVFIGDVLRDVPDLGYLATA